MSDWNSVKIDRPGYMILNPPMSKEQRILRDLELEAEETGDRTELIRFKRQMVQEHRRPKTQEEIDYAEAMKELDEIAPGWKE